MAMEEQNYNNRKKNNQNKNKQKRANFTLRGGSSPETLSSKSASTLSAEKRIHHQQLILQ